MKKELINIIYDNELKKKVREIKEKIAECTLLNQNENLLCCIKKFFKKPEKFQIMNMNWKIMRNYFFKKTCSKPNWN